MWDTLLSAGKECAFVVLLAAVLQVRGADDCGGFIDARSVAGGIFRSPNYPDHYSNAANCIWLIEAPVQRVVVLSVYGVNAEELNGTCVDYLEVRAGSSSAPLLFKNCTFPSNTTLTSPSRWMWVRFTSNGRTTNTGFYSTWTTLNSTENYTDANTSINQNPVKACPSPQYTCPNRECISMSWVCDGVYDCGCTGSGCDEKSCWGTTISVTARMAIGLSLGVVLFIVAVILALYSENIDPWPPFRKKQPETNDSPKK